MHIGLIGGIGPAATDFYYRGLIDRHVAAGVPLDVTICEMLTISAQTEQANSVTRGRIFHLLVWN